MFTRPILLLSLSIFCACMAFGQESDMLIGEWKNYFPHRNGPFVTQSQDYVFYGDAFSIIKCDKSANIQKIITKNDGLSDIDLSAIKYIPYKRTLLINYTNGNIDLYHGDNEVTNLNDIKINSNIVGKKTLNHIQIMNDSSVLLSTDFGLLVLDLANTEFTTTVFTPVKIKSTCLRNDTVFAATDAGFYVLAPGINIQDFGQWKRLDLKAGKDYSSTACVNYNNQIYFSFNDTLVKFQGDTSYKKLFYEKNTQINYLTAEGKHLIGGIFCTANNYCAGKVLSIDPNENVSVLSGSSCFTRPLYAVEDSNNRLWMGDEWDEYKYYDIESGQCNSFTINSPRAETNFDISFANNKVYITSGGLILGQNYSYNSNGIYVYDLMSKIWDNISNKKFSILDQTQCQNDFLYLAPKPSDTKKIYSGSFYGGLIEYDGEKINVFNKDNSALQGGVGDESRTRVAGLAFDSHENLWMANTLAQKPIVCLKKDGTWQSFPINASTAIYQLAIDQNNNKWFVIGGQTGGIYVFNEGNDFNNTNDDKWREITTANSNLPSNTINCIEVDNNGDVWVGTSSGPIVFECGSDIFDSNCKGTRVIVEQDGFGAYLLETENIKIITIDGGNRKWFGTDNGIFVQSDDVKTQVYKFDEKNSPLPSNSITSMAINPNNGEVWIGTTKGFAVYRMEATAGGTLHASKVYAFPNPVRPEYAGPIIITGLATDSDVKITDANGKLVFQTKSTGGQATWYGTDYNGRRADSGVYLVFATGTSDPEIPDGIVTKILLVN